MDLEREYLLQNYARYPLVLARGKGCYVYDLDGRRYLDFITGIGVNALGHAHPRIVKVIREQAGLLIHCSNLYYHQYQGPLAKRLAEMSGLARAFFANTGTEAMEGALKMVALARARHPSREVRDHRARELASTAAPWARSPITGQPKYRHDFEPLMPGVKFVPANDVAALEAAFSEPHRGHGDGDDPGRGRHLSADARVRGQGARTGRPPQRPAGGRRNAVRRGPPGHVLRLPALASR